MESHSTLATEGLPLHFTHKQQSCLATDPADTLLQDSELIEASLQAKVMTKSRKHCVSSSCVNEKRNRLDHNVLAKSRTRKGFERFIKSRKRLLGSSNNPNPREDTGYMNPVVEGSQNGPHGEEGLVVSLRGSLARKRKSDHENHCNCLNLQCSTSADECLLHKQRAKARIGKRGVDGKLKCGAFLDDSTAFLQKSETATNSILKVPAVVASNSLKNHLIAMSLFRQPRKLPHAAMPVAFTGQSLLHGKSMPGSIATELAKMTLEERTTWMALFQSCSAPIVGSNPYESLDTKNGIQAAGLDTMTSNSTPSNFRTMDAHPKGKPSGMHEHQISLQLQFCPKPASKLSTPVPLAYGCPIPPQKAHSVPSSMPTASVRPFWPMLGSLSAGGAMYGGASSPLHSIPSHQMMQVDSIFSKSSMGRFTPIAPAPSSKDTKAPLIPSSSSSILMTCIFCQKQTSGMTSKVSLGHATEGPSPVLSATNPEYLEPCILKNDFFINFYETCENLSLINTDR